MSAVLHIQKTHFGFEGFVSIKEGRSVIKHSWVSALSYSKMVELFQGVSAKYPAIEKKIIEFEY